MEMLEIEFSHQPVLLFYHTWLIVTIRREVNLQTALEAYRELWKIESDFLIKHLSTRKNGSTRR